MVPYIVGDVVWWSPAADKLDWGDYRSINVSAVTAFSSFDAGQPARMGHNFAWDNAQVISLDPYGRVVVAAAAAILVRDFRSYPLFLTFSSLPPSLPLSLHQSILPTPAPPTLAPAHSALARLHNAGVEQGHDCDPINTPRL